MLYLKELAGGTYALYYKDETHHLFLGAFSVDDLMIQGLRVRHES